MFRFFVGIDVAKLKHDVAIINQEGNPIGKSFSIANSGEGLAVLCSRLGELGSISDLHIGLEATGPYGWPLHHHLCARGYALVVLNPLITGAFAKTRIRRTKTDEIDALAIARLIRLGKSSASLIPDERSLRLRELTRYRNAVVSLLCRFTNLLNSRVYRTFPEFGGCFHSLWSPSALGILENHPLPTDLQALPPEDLASELRKFSQGRLGRKTVERLQNTARTTIGVPIAGDVFALEIRGIVGVVRLLQRNIHTITSRISEVLKEVPQPLTSIPGVGDLSAAAILGEIVDIRFFDDPKKLVAFAGFDPSTFQTGQFLGDHASISKRGSPHLRRALWNAAFAAIRYNDDLKAHYQRFRAKGKHHKSALSAVCRKLLHVIWRLLTDNRPYEIRPMAH